MKHVLKVFLVCIEDKTDSLENPVGNVVSGSQVSVKHKPHPHGIPALRGSVDRSTESILQKKEQ